ncbi:MAG: lytic transglycosylase domain-containing protein [Chloroflexi bacterium]|nr:lytic transglycosylase domain-containing protein [Chloroflexota bacterium]
MNIHPKNIILPAILIASVALLLVSIQVNDGYASSRTHRESLQKDQTEIHAPFLSSHFPQEIQRWKSLIEKYAQANNLDPNLIGALILQESGGQPSIVSSSGAVGLMQVMPRDGIAAQFMCINGPCFTARPTSHELSDPEFNLRYGSQMLSGLINKKGNLREALKSYGPADYGYNYADIVLALKARYE